MTNRLNMAFMAAMIVAPIAVSTPVAAHDAEYYRTHNYHGRDRHYRRHCGGGNGAVGGALLGNAVGGGTLGTVAGGVGGALLGRHLDKKNTEHRRGC